MSDIRFNQWLHQSGTGGVSQVASGAVGVGTTNPLADFYVRGDVQITGILTAGHISLGSSITFGDNDRIYLGDNQDFQLYHNSTDNNSYIVESGAGSLVVNASALHVRNAANNENLAMFSQGGNNELYFSNSKKFETTNTGVLIVGICTATTFVGNLTGNVTGNSTTATDLAINATQRLVIQTGNNATDILAAGTSGHFLKSQGSGSVPIWAAVPGLTYFTESENTSSPNNSVSANRFIATGSASNIDYVASPKGTGSNLSQLPDSGTGGGNKRGTYATDWQKERDNANQVASGNYSSIGGGRKNRASGLYSHIGGGQQNTATGHAAVVAGGEDSDATGGNSTVGGGYLNKAESSGTTVAGGVYNTAPGSTSYSTIVGGARGKTRWEGHTVLGGHSDTVMGSNGGQQAGLTVYQRQTTNATATTISTNSGNSGDTLRLVTLPNNSAYGFTITLIAAVTGGGNSSMWKYEGLIKRGANAGSTAIVGTVVKNRIAYDSGASAWDADVTADTTNGSIKITVTGQASTTIRWMARIETTELTYS